jgi:hypothetical protein
MSHGGARQKARPDWSKPSVARGTNSIVYRELFVARLDLRSLETF